MLALQRNIDFDDVEVVLINDGEESRLPDDLFKDYPFEVRNLTPPHGGVSRARNAGIDNAAGEWVMICDFDDTFMSLNGLHILLTAAKDDRKVMWWSHFIEETIKEDGSIIYLPHGRDYIFNHGKMFRKSWLDKENLRFCDKLTLHEDVYFNTLTQAVAPDEQIGEIESGFYCWCWNGTSVSRSFRNMLIETYNHQIRQRIAICRQLEARGLSEALELSVIKTIIDGYYDFQKSDWLDREFSKEYKMAERWFKAFFEEYGDIYRKCDPKKIAGMAKASREYHMACGGFLMERFTMREFVIHIANDVKAIPKEQWDL